MLGKLDPDIFPVPKEFRFPSFPVRHKTRLHFIYLTLSIRDILTKADKD